MLWSPLKDRASSKQSTMLLSSGQNFLNERINGQLLGSLHRSCVIERRFSGKLAVIYAQKKNRMLLQFRINNSLVISRAGILKGFL